MFSGTFSSSYLQESITIITVIVYKIENILYILYLIHIIYIYYKYNIYIFVYYINIYYNMLFYNWCNKVSNQISLYFLYWLLCFIRWEVLEHANSIIFGENYMSAHSIFQLLMGLQLLQRKILRDQCGCQNLSTSHLTLSCTTRHAYVDTAFLKWVLGSKPRTLKVFKYC